MICDRTGFIRAVLEAARNAWLLARRFSLVHRLVLCYLKLLFSVLRSLLCAIHTLEQPQELGLVVFKCAAVHV